MDPERDEVRIRADEIIDGIVHRKCPNCGELKPLDAFGLRRMAGHGKGGRDVLTNQSRCRACR
jgi:hypothetical protein